MFKVDIPFIWLKLFGAFSMLSIFLAMLLGPPYRLSYQAFVGFADSPYAEHRFELFIFTLIIMFFALFFDRKYFVLQTERAKLKEQVKNFILIVLGFIMFVFMFIYMGFPALLYPLANNYIEHRSMINEINLSPSRRSGCRSGAEIHFEEDRHLSSGVCVSKNFAKNLKKGDTLILEGWHIPKFGIFVERIYK